MSMAAVERRSAFSLWLTTGRRPAREPDVELKFNPNHDPDDGRFTFASGGGRAPGRVADRRSAPTRAAGSAPSVPYLSSLHNEIIGLAANYPPAPGTREWPPVDVGKWVTGQENIFQFKDQWVRGYRDAIIAAADRFDLPAQLVAGVAHIEVGGDPLFIDGLAYSARSDAMRDRTSFGDMSVQVGRAAQALGYGTSQSLTSSQRRMVIASLEQPQTSIFVAAKHLSDLRDIDYKSVPGSRLTQSQIEVIATRYNRGPDLRVEQIRNNLDYGKDLVKRWALLSQLLKR